MFEGRRIKFTMTHSANRDFEAVNLDVDHVTDIGVHGYADDEWMFIPWTSVAYASR